MLKKTSLLLVILFQVLPAIPLSNGAGEKSGQTTSSNSTKVAHGYFPKGTFDASDASADERYADGLANFLNAIGEPSLLGAPESSIRLVWSAMPSGKALVVRLTPTEDGGALLFTKLTQGGPHNLTSTQKRISHGDFEKCLELVDRNEFWSMPRAEVAEPPLSKDGTMWYLEAIKNTKYKMVYRRNPKPSRYTEIACYMAKALSKLDDTAFNSQQCP